MTKPMQSEPTPMRDTSRDLRNEEGRRLYPYTLPKLWTEGEHPPNTVPVFETDQIGRDAALKPPPVQFVRRGND